MTFFFQKKRVVHKCSKWSYSWDMINVEADNFNWWNGFLKEPWNLCNLLLIVLSLLENLLFKMSKGLFLRLSRVILLLYLRCCFTVISRESIEIPAFFFTINIRLTSIWFLRLYWCGFDLLSRSLDLNLNIFYGYNIRFLDCCCRCLIWNHGYLII